MTDTPKAKRFSVYTVERCSAEGSEGDERLEAWLNRNLYPHERLITAHPQTMTDGNNFTITWKLLVENTLGRGAGV